MVKEVWPYLAAGMGMTAILALMGLTAWAVVCLAMTAAVASFFRDPRRAVPGDPRLLVSPADGRVVSIAHGTPGAPVATVSIFLSVFNVHVNRAPAAGRVTDIRYTPGSFLPAFRDKASELNEQNLIRIETARGPVAVKQIAGLIARRIRCWTRAGEMVGQGQKIGFITFGSRVDLSLPPGAEIRVRVGDRVRGGTSIVAAYPDTEMRS